MAVTLAPSLYSPRWMLILFYFPALNQSAARLHLQVRAHPGQGSPGEASEGCPGSESHAEGLFSFLYSLLFRPIWHIVKHVVTPSTLNLFIVCIEKSLRNFCGICSTSNNSSNVCRICLTRKHVQRQLRLSPPCKSCICTYWDSKSHQISVEIRNA